jgi:hypothetical protein
LDAGREEEGVKRILSEVPVEADGSVHFQAPAGRSLFFQLLDADRRCLQTMRSFSGLMPGERRGCLGCHEQHSTSPPQQSGIALGRAPTGLSPPPWGMESIGYERFVYLGEPEVRALGDPDFPGIDRLPIRPRVDMVPAIERPRRQGCAHGAFRTVPEGRRRSLRFAGVPLA